MRRDIAVAVALIGFLAGFIPVLLTARDANSPLAAGSAADSTTRPGQLVPVWSAETYAGLPYGPGTSNAFGRLYTVNSSVVVTPADHDGLMVRV